MSSAPEEEVKRLILKSLRTLKKDELMTVGGIHRLVNEQQEKNNRPRVGRPRIATLIETLRGENFVTLTKVLPGNSKAYKLSEKGRDELKKEIT